MLTQEKIVEELAKHNIESKFTNRMCFQHGYNFALEQMKPKSISELPDNFRGNVVAFMKFDDPESNYATEVMFEIEDELDMVEIKNDKYVTHFIDIPKNPNL